MTYIREIVGTLIVSALIGLGVGGLFGFAHTGSFFPGIPEGALAGVVIGFISRIGFILVYLPLRRIPAVAYLAVALIIAAGTLGFCLLWGLPFPLPGIPVIIVSEILGLGATALLFRTYSTLNSQLEGKIKKLTESGKENGARQG